LETSLPNWLAVMWSSHMNRSLTCDVYLQVKTYVPSLAAFINPDVLVTH